MKTILIFDTGAGGLAFADYLQKQSNYNVKTVTDDVNAPYGRLSENKIQYLTEKAIAPYIGAVEVIVLACNTATGAAIDYLREKYPQQTFVGFEPMLKSAEESSVSRKVMVLATDATKKSDRYRRLKQRFCDIDVIEPDCHDWAKKIDDRTLTRNDIETVLNDHIENVDVIVLACTHYVTIRGIIEEIVGSGVRVIDPFQSVANRIHQVVK